MSYWRFGAAVLLLASFGFGDEDVFESCVHHEVCVEEEGKDRSMECIYIMAKPDLDLLVETFSDVFPSGGNDIRLLIELSCKDREKAKKAVNHYYDSRLERDKKNVQPTSEKQKMVEARGCFMMLIEECRTKRVMGLISK